MTDDLEKQANSDSDDEVDGDDKSRKIVAEQRFWWFIRSFVWFSALFFPISALSEYGLLLRCPSVDLSGGNECYQKARVPTNGPDPYTNLVRFLTNGTREVGSL